MGMRKEEMACDLTSNSISPSLRLSGVSLGPASEYEFHVPICEEAAAFEIENLNLQSWRNQD